MEPRGSAVPGRLLGKDAFTRWSAGMRTVDVPPAGHVRPHRLSPCARARTRRDSRMSECSLDELDILEDWKSTTEESRMRMAPGTRIRSLVCETRFGRAYAVYEKVCPSYQWFREAAATAALDSVNPAVITAMVPCPSPGGPVYRPLSWHSWDLYSSGAIPLVFPAKSSLENRTWRRHQHGAPPESYATVMGPRDAANFPPYVTMLFAPAMDPGWWIRPGILADLPERAPRPLSGGGENDRGIRIDLQANAPQMWRSNYSTLWSRWSSAVSGTGRIPRPCRQRGYRRKWSGTCLWAGTMGDLGRGIPDPETAVDDLSKHVFLLTGIAGGVGRSFAEEDPVSGLPAWMSIVLLGPEFVAWSVSTFYEPIGYYSFMGRGQGPLGTFGRVFQGEGGAIRPSMEPRALVAESAFRAYLRDDCWVEVCECLDFVLPGMKLRSYPASFVAGAEWNDILASSHHRMVSGGRLARTPDGSVAVMAGGNFFGCSATGNWRTGPLRKPAGFMASRVLPRAPKSRPAAVPGSRIGTRCEILDSSVA